MKRATIADIFFQAAQIGAIILTGGAVGIGTYYALQYGFYGYVKSASFFRTHPPFLERIISTFSEITYLPPQPDLLVDSSDFSKAKKRVAELIKKREDEEKTRPTLRGRPKT